LRELLDLENKYVGFVGKLEKFVSQNMFEFVRILGLVVVVVVVVCLCDRVFCSGGWVVGGGLERRSRNKATVVVN
jgi:hypothetical protein